MPRTRNITRAQWQAAQATLDENAPASSTATRATRSTTTRTRRTPTTTSTLKSTTPVAKAKAASKAAATKSKATAARAAPSKEGKGKSGTETLRKKQPLQDITAEIVGQLASSHPGAAANAPPPIAYTSPLPPSSPPPASTSSPLALRPYQTPHADFLGLPPSQSSIDALPIAIASASQGPTYDGFGPDETTQDPWGEFDSTMDNEEDQDPTPRNSDPFGFFALERKLKAEREQPRREAGGVVLVPATSDAAEEEGLRPHGYFATPPMPPTPHKQKDKGRVTAGKRASLPGDGEEAFSPRTDSMPSTPSPMKPHARASAAHGLAEQHGNGDDEEEDDEVANDIFDSPPKGLKRTRAATKESAHGSKRARTTVDPVKLAKSLDVLLPKRASRGINAKGKGKAAVRKDEDEDEEDGQRKRKGTTAGKKIVGKGKTRNGPNASGGGNDELPDEEADRQERLERERRERVEYFRRLEGYEVEKENVYIV